MKTYQGKAFIEERPKTSTHLFAIKSLMSLILKPFGWNCMKKGNISFVTQVKTNTCNLQTISFLSREKILFSPQFVCALHFVTIDLYFVGSFLVIVLCLVQDVGTFLLHFPPTEENGEFQKCPKAFGQPPKCTFCFLFLFLFLQVKENLV